ncbi:MAG: IS4 family transposase, partial [Desulfatiglandaceae bacterium]
MKEVKLLKNALKRQIPMNAARLFCLAGIIIALFKVGTVNFTQLAVAFPGKAKKESKYRRIQRFFESVSFDDAMLANLIAKFPGINYKLWTLTIDRTNWKFGKLNIIILTLG